MMDGDDRDRGAPRVATGADDELARRIEALEQDLASARDESRQAHERWLRERADLENLKKRAARERTETVRFANESLIRDLLPVVDNLERAVEHAQGGGNGQPLVEGVALVLKALRDVLERHGVQQVAAKGVPFDPTHHEAMAQVESAEHEPNVVVEEHQRGYRLNDRLLRPALVTVARAPDKVVKDKDRG
jgi:molecular chaperone GrpE